MSKLLESLLTKLCSLYIFAAGSILDPSIHVSSKLSL